MRYVRLVLALAASSQLFAGGFWLQLGNPDASAEARRINGVVIIKAVGCHDPTAAQVSANAIGIVDGKRQTIPLKLTPLAEPGTYVLTQQWPKNGRWVIQVVGKNGEQFTNTLITAGSEGLDRLHAKSDRKQFTEGEVDALLNN